MALTQFQLAHSIDRALYFGHTIAAARRHFDDAPDTTLEPTEPTRAGILARAIDDCHAEPSATDRASIISAYELGKARDANYDAPMSRADYYDRLTANVRLFESLFQDAAIASSYEAGGGTAYADWLLSDRGTDEATFVAVILSDRLGDCEVQVGTVTFDKRTAFEL